MAKEGKREEGASAGSARSGHSGVCPGRGVSRSPGSPWERRRAGVSACVSCSTCPRRRGRAQAQLTGFELLPVSALALCVPGRVAGSGFESLCPPPPPTPSVPPNPLPCLSLCPCLSWGRGMLLPAEVTVNPVGSSPPSAQTLPYSFDAHPSVFGTTVLGRRRQQLRDTRVTPGDHRPSRSQVLAQ